MNNNKSYNRFAKALFTVHVATQEAPLLSEASEHNGGAACCEGVTEGAMNGKCIETLVVPFNVDKTCGELLAEVRRRVQRNPELGASLSTKLQALRIGSLSGGALYENDLLEDILLHIGAEGNGKQPGFTLYATIGKPSSPSSRQQRANDVFLGQGSTPMGGDYSEQESLENESATSASGAQHGVSNSEQDDSALARLAAAWAVLGQQSTAALALAKSMEQAASAAAMKTGSKSAQMNQFAQNGILPQSSTQSSSSGRRRHRKNSNKDKAERGDAMSRKSAISSATAAATSALMSGNSPFQISTPMPASVSQFPAASSSSNEVRVSCEGRRVEWRISQLRDKLISYPRGTRMSSPEFEMLNMGSMALILYLNGNTNSKPGYCSLGLRAPHGAHLRYKLFVGRVERFTELRQNVTESWGFVDMARIEQEAFAENALTVGVEVIDNIDENEELQVAPESGRVEWIVRNLNMKQRYYVREQPMFSDEFSVPHHGERLRFKFFPNGRSDSEIGMCALFVEANRRFDFPYRLSIGGRAASIDRIESVGEGNVWGYTSLCRIDEVADGSEGDCIRIVLESTGEPSKCPTPKVTDAEEAWLRAQSLEVRKTMLEKLALVEKAKAGKDGDMPIRFRIAQLPISESARAIALSKLELLQGDCGGGAEASKVRKWLDGLLSIPFGQCKSQSVSLTEDGPEKVREYILQSSKTLDSAIFGHKEAKTRITELLSQWVSNPASKSLVLGIQGPPGNGKTSLCRKGLAAALGRPFVQISLGGATDAAVLEGHSYTYVGSTWGRIAGLLMECGSMNPIIFFDELDKVSGTPRGDEITGVLTHLTDYSQNTHFSDKYFDGIPIDVSQCLFVFSFNDASKINPILLDRLTIVNTNGFGKEDKFAIAKDFLLPELLENSGMPKNSVQINSSNALSHLMDRWGLNVTEESGVRGLKQALEQCVMRVNHRRLVGAFDESKNERPTNLPLNLTTEVIDDLIPVKRGGDASNSAPAFMYS